MPTQAELARRELARRELARRAAASGSLGVGVQGNAPAPPPTYSRTTEGVVDRVVSAADSARQGAQDSAYELSKLTRFLPGGSIIETAPQAFNDRMYHRLPRRVPNGMIERNAERIGGLAPNALVPGGLGVRVASVVLPWAGGAIGRALNGDTGEAYGELAGSLLSPSGEANAAEEAGTLLRRHGRNMGAINPVDLNLEAQRLRASGVMPAFVDLTNENGRAVTGTFASRGVTGSRQVNAFVAARERNLPGAVVTATREHVSPTPVRAPERVETVVPGQPGAAVSATLNTSRDAALRNVDRAYAAAREAGAERLLVPRTEIPVLRDNLQRSVVGGWDEGTAPGVYREIDNLTNRQDVTVEDLMRSRTRLGNLAQSNDRVLASAARTARRALDGEISRLESVVSGPDATGPNAVAAWRRANRIRARYGRQYEGGDLLERLTAREPHGGDFGAQVVPTEAASNAALGSGQTVRVGNDTLRDFRRLRGRLGPNSAEWRAFQDEATDRLIGNNPNSYGEAYRAFAARNPDVAALLVPADRRAELLAAQGERGGRRVMDLTQPNPLEGVTAAQLQDARNAAAGVIERRARSGGAADVIDQVQLPEMHDRLVSILGSDAAATAFERRLAAEQELVGNARQIRTPPVPQLSNPIADAAQTAGAVTAAAGGLQHGMLFSQTTRWASKFRINPEAADRFTQAALDPAQTDAILREVRRGYGPSAERALRGIIRRARRAPGTVGSAAGALNGNAE